MVSDKLEGLYNVKLYYKYHVNLAILHIILQCSNNNPNESLFDIATLGLINTFCLK